MISARRIVVTGAVALSLGLAGPTFAASPPSLTGNVTMSGDTGYVLVHLDAALSLGFEDRSARPTFRFDGPTPYTTVALRAEHEGEDGERPELIANGDAEGSFVGVNTDTLPPGDYRLFLYAPDGRATVRIAFPTLTGATTLSPTFAVAPQAATATSRPSSVSSNTVVVGKTLELATDGVSFADIKAEFPGVLKLRRTEWCLYPFDAGSADASSAYEPTCPNGFSFSGDPLTGLVPTGEAGVLTSTDEFGLVSMSFGDGGRLGIGGNFTFLEEPPAISAAYRWVSFGVPGTRIAQPISTTTPNFKSRPGVGRLVVVSRRAGVRGSLAAVTLRCMEPRAGCRGTVGLAGGRRVAVSTATRSSIRLRLPVPRALRARLRAQGSARARVVVRQRSRARSQRILLLRKG